jgi:hypothetical protein
VRGDNITPADWEDVRRSWSDGNGVPPWVHLVEVPPPTDEEPGHTLAPLEADRSGAIIVWLLGAILLATVACIAVVEWRSDD